VAITGQVPQARSARARSRTDVFSVTAQVVKPNYLVMDVNDIPRIGRSVFIAQSGRPGRCSSTSEEHPARDHAPISQRSPSPWLSSMKHADDVALNKSWG